MPTPWMPSRLHRMRWKLVAGATAIALSLGAAAALRRTWPLRAHPLLPPGPTPPTPSPWSPATSSPSPRSRTASRPPRWTGPTTPPAGSASSRVGGDLYVLPDEVLPLLRAGQLDRRLFNVTDLIEMGYDDAKTAEVPLIATYEPARPRRRRPRQREAGSSASWPSIGGAALTADKKQAREFWTASRLRHDPTTLGSGVTKLWLDGRVKASLAESVPQVGAPQAWAAGLRRGGRDGRGAGHRRRRHPPGPGRPDRRQGQLRTG